MRYLRTVSTQRLLAIVAGLVIAAAGGTAIAVAAAGNGPVPPPKPLAQAVHDAFAAPAVTGITARITFTNHLIDATAIQGSDPLLQGASGRLWLSSNHQLRLELQSDNGDAQVVVNNGAFWVYDPSSNTVYKGKLPADTQSAKKPAADKAQSLPSVSQIQTDLNKAMQHVLLSGATPSDVAGRPTYTVRVSPQHDGGLLGAVQLAWDSVHGVPLRVAVYSRGDSTPVLELKATNISFGAVPASDFNIAPPSNAKVVQVSTLGAGSAASAAGRRSGSARKHPDVTGAAAVAKRLPFKLVAPTALVGLPRQSVQLLDWGGHPAALVTYGQNLGGIAVVEQVASASASSSSSSNSSSSSKSGGGRNSLSLPTVSINGVTGQELDTALGTMIRFTRSGVAYTVIGSVPPTAADAAAKAL